MLRDMHQSIVEICLFSCREGNLSMSFHITPFESSRCQALTIMVSRACLNPLQLGNLYVNSRHMEVLFWCSFSKCRSRLQQWLTWMMILVGPSDDCAECHAWFDMHHVLGIFWHRAPPTTLLTPAHDPRQNHSETSYLGPVLATCDLYSSHSL